MITKTTACALRLLQYVAGNKEGPGPVSLRRAARDLEESPSYIAKIARDLVKAGILRSERGVRGGVILNRSRDQLTLLDVVQACQGTLLADNCQAKCSTDGVCSYHRAAVELRDATVAVLERWSLARLMVRPSVMRVGSASACIMARAQKTKLAPGSDGGAA